MVAPARSFPSVLAAATLLATAHGHGYMTAPKVTFLSSSTDNTQFIATIESSASGFSGSFSGSPADNTAAFTTAFKASSYSSLKELINDKATITVTDATLTCGSCDPDETAQPLPDQYVEWSHSSSEGFTSSHEGPCEVWCDDTRAFQDDDCAADYTSAPAELPYDRDSCTGASTLTFYWLALHSSTWQVYVNCAPLESSSGTSTSNNTSSTTTSSSSTATTSGSTTSTTTSTSTSSPSASTTTENSGTTSTTTGNSGTSTTTGSSGNTGTTGTSTTTSTTTGSTGNTGTSGTSTTTGSSGTTSNQWTSTSSTGSTTKRGWTTSSTGSATNGGGTANSTTGTSTTGNEYQKTSGTVSPSNNTASGGWGNTNTNANGWGTSFGFRH